MLREKQWVDGVGFLRQVVLQDNCEKALDANEQQQGGDNYEGLTSIEAAVYVMKLHPKHREDRLDSLPEYLDDDEPAGLVVTCEEVLKAINLLKKDSAQGASGVTNNAIKFLAFYGNQEQATAFGTALAAVFNKIYDGTMTEQVRWMWTRVRSLLIPKPEPGTYRPIGIGDAWYRLLIKVLYAQETVEIGEKLAPRQLAVGVPGGAEIGARMVHVHYNKQHYSDSDWRLAPAIIEVDSKNCWNLASTVLALARLREYAPRTVRGFHWTHYGKSDLVHGNGEILGQREIGFRQGDPASTINASLALEDTMDRLEIELREIEAQLRLDLGDIGQNLPEGHLVASADDGNILTTLGVAVLLAAKIPEIYAFDRLEVVLKKSKIVSAYADKVPANEWPEGWIKAREGAVVLGAPIGSDEYILNYLVNKVEEIKPPLKATGRLSNRLGMYLTKFCWNTELDYLCRIVEPNLMIGSVKLQDKNIDQAICQLADIDGGDEIPMMLRGLSVGSGGCGVPRHLCRLEAGATISRARTHKFIESCYPDLLVAIHQEEIWREIVIGEADGKPNACNYLNAEERAQLVNMDAPMEVEKTAKKLIAIVDKEILHDEYDRLIQEGKLGQCKLAFLRSCEDKDSGRWIGSLHGIEGGLAFMSNGDF